MKILISGEGGQGVQIISELLAKAGHKIDLNVSYMPSYGVEQRGGASLAYLQISKNKIIYPKFNLAEILVAMSNRAVETLENHVDENSIFIFDCSNIEEEFINSIRPKVTKFLSIPAREYANKNLSTKVTNMIFLGAILNYLPEINIDEIKALLQEKLKDKKDKSEFLEMDLKAIDYGLAFAKSPQNQELKGTSLKKIEEKFEDSNKSWQRHPELCKGCGLCIVRCPVKALSFGNDLNFLGTPMPKIDIDKCIACGLCQQTCPDGAIKMSKKK